MPFYLYQLAYSRDAIKGMVANPSDRKAAAKQLIEAAGGRLHDFFFCFGEYDVVVIVEAPDDATWAGGALAVAAAGTTARAATTKLMTAEEAMKAMATAGKAAAAYKPPMS